MHMKIYIGCDVGTSSTKAVAVDEKGKILAEASKGYGLVQKHNNWAEQDPDLWLDGAQYTIRECVRQTKELGEVGAICISALYGGTGAMCDENLNSVRPALIWMDRRAEEESAWVREVIGEERIFDVTDNGTDPYFGYTKLLWVRNHEPGNWEKIRWVLPANTYIVAKMTGELAVDYSSAGNFGGVYDYRGHCWSEELCREMGIPFEWLPERLCAPYEVAGQVNEEYTGRLGLDHPVPLLVGTIDCISSMLSANAVLPGDNAAVLGTSLNWGILHTQLAEDPRIISMPYAVRPKEISYSYGGASTAGALPRWFVNSFCGGDSGAIYSEVEHEVIDQKIGPGSNGLVVLPYFMGERTPIWDQNATGVFFGLTLGHTRAHIYHAILEAVAYSLRDIMDSMGTEGEGPDKIVLVGGGSRSLIWKKVFANVTGLPVYTPVNPVEAPLGDAFMAALADGVYDDFSRIEGWIEFHDPVLPDEDAHREYERWFRMYKKLYADLKDTMQERAKNLAPTSQI